MNEYQDIYEKTLVNDHYINNKDYLDTLSPMDLRVLKIAIDLNNYFNTINPQIGPIDATINSTKYKLTLLDEVQKKLISIANSDTFQQLVNTDIRGIKLMENTDVGSIKGLDSKLVVETLHKVDLEILRKFYLFNKLEYDHQNMARGPITHIGQILNPINEYELGRPLKDIYIQYGLGDMLIFKWTMDLFGGTSIETYYKNYIYYALYFLLFLIMSYMLFREGAYVLASLAFLSNAYFFQGYIPLMLAPGIIPIIHFMDVLVIICMLLYSRVRNPIYLVTSISLALLAILINKQFGMMLSVALCLACFFYSYENIKERHKYSWYLFPAILFLISVSLFLIAPSGKVGDTYLYFLTGLFSWPADRIIISLTIIYLTISYSFILLLKKERFHLKYIYLFVFFYTQCLFVYFYWSGLTNHLPTVLPFLGLQIIIMFVIARKIFEQNMELLKITHAFFNGFLYLSLLLVIINGYHFYRQKIEFRSIFVNHTVYHWDFKKANLISTIDPDILKNSMNLIQQFSQDNGIYILSKYDNVIPFLSNKYSLMPFSFEMTWNLLSDKETQLVFNQINTEKPQYIFVDNNIESSIDPWEKIYSNSVDIKERSSRMDRNAGLKKIFEAVQANYEKIEEGLLISVYKRKVI